MIISALLSLFRGFFNLVCAGLAFIDVPSDVVSVLQTILSYLQQAVQFVAAYTHFSYLQTLIAFVIAFDTMQQAYLFFRWVYQKIPMWGLH